MTPRTRVAAENRFERPATTASSNNNFECFAKDSRYSKSVLLEDAGPRDNEKEEAEGSQKTVKMDTLLWLTAFAQLDSTL